jgi:hypothetical protein
MPCVPRQFTSSTSGLKRCFSKRAKRKAAHRLRTVGARFTQSGPNLRSGLEGRMWACVACLPRTSRCCPSAGLYTYR